MQNRKLLSVATILGYLVMIVVNALANILPINGIGTGQVSDKYANLFAPAGYVFSIWILIYILLAMYSVYQYNLFGRRSDMSDRVVYRVNQYFLWSSLLNTGWIFAWHYEKIGISLLLMIGIFYMLLRARITITHRSNLTHDENISVKLPFSVYFGWISIATIANVTAFLVSIQWNRWGISEESWAMILLIIGTLIGLVTMIKWNDLAYGIVFVWAYSGILIKHISASDFGGKYFGVIVVSSTSIVLFVLVLLFLFVRSLKSKRKKRSQLYQGSYAPKFQESNDFFEDIEL